MLPELYLHGLATGDFELALRGLLGDGAPLSSASLQRLKTKWQLEYESWKKQDLSGLKIVYQWADGLSVKAGLEKDKAALLVVIGAEERMVTFYSFPQEHWSHLRTTNVVESPFNAIRLRTNAVRRFKKVQNATAMIWRLLMVAEKRFRILKGSEKLESVYEGRQYKDGIEIKTNLQTERMAA